MSEIPFLTENSRALDRYAAPTDYLDDPDAIVIGSGIGGLGLAALLARLKGWRVLVLEANDVPGGCMHVHERDGFEFPSGIDSVGEMERGLGRGIFRPTIDYITNDELEWAKMPAVHEVACFGEDEYRWHDSAEANVDWLAERFGDRVSRERFEGYYALEDEVYDSAYGWALTKLMPQGMPRFLRELVFRLKGSTWRKYTRLKTREVFQDQLGFPEDVTSVFNFSYGNLGRTPARSPFTLHATAFHHYRWGAFYPVGGAGQIVECIVPVIEDAGGQVAVGSKVERIDCEGRRAIGVTLADGTELRAPRVISDAGAYVTFAELLPRELAERFGYLGLFDQLGPSPIHLYLHVGWDQWLDLPQHIVWEQPGYDIERQDARYKAEGNLDDAGFYLLAPSVRDVSFKERYPNKSTVAVLGEATVGTLERFRSDAAFRTELEQRITERCLKSIHRHMPMTVGVEPAFVEAGIPMGCNPWAWDSCSYGLEGSSDRYGKHTHVLQPHTKVKGLYLTGQDTFSPGFAGALMGARFAYTAVTGDYRFQLRQEPGGE
jgi:phytoene dehydrogenase-like protein